MLESLGGVGGGTSRRYFELYTLKSIDHSTIFHLTLTSQAESAHIPPETGHKTIKQLFFLGMKILQFETTILESIL